MFNIILTPLLFYIVKLGFTEVYIIFLISAQKRRLWVPLIEVVLMNTHNLFLSRNMKIRFLAENFHFWW